MISDFLLVSAAAFVGGYASAAFGRWLRKRDAARAKAGE